MEQSTFEGWAEIELFGHAREAGYVTTKYFGPAALLHVQVPEIAARRETSTRPGYIDGRRYPAGTIAELQPIPPRERYIGFGSVYALNPCSEERVRRVVEEIGGRKIEIVYAPLEQLLPSAAVPQAEGYDDEFDPDDDDDHDC
jgi:hypothetical protein